jgi:dTDP-4-amino-4,6-dideoxygalactose transaminase
MESLQKKIQQVNPALFHWPIVTEEDERAVLEVLRTGTMSGTDITKKFEAEFASWMEVKYALAVCNGTAGLLAALWACQVGSGDEIICPSMTYWASAAPALMLGATVNFADIDPISLCIDPKDIESRISSRTKVIMVVHYAGHPCDMDAISAIAKKHGLRIIEDTSHAQGSYYKGRLCGTIGDIGVMSLMAGKSLAIGEGGMIVTNDRNLYERCVAFGHYERTGIPSRWNPPDNQITDPTLAAFRGIPLGAAKHRMNQTCSAMGRVQLKYYMERIAEIQEAINYFWDNLSDLKGIYPHRIDPAIGTMGGWYFPHGLFRSEELGGVSCEKFCAAVREEGDNSCWPGANNPLHVHPFFHEADIFNQGKPTAIAFGQRDVRQGWGSLPVSERIDEICFSIPWFKHCWKNEIDLYIEAYRRAYKKVREK